jgi:hypothetical protein
MTDPVTTYRGVTIPTVGGDSGTWGTVMNNSSWAGLDSAIGGFAQISVTNANVTLNATQDQCAILRVTGTLTGNVQITTAQNGLKYIENKTTAGSFALSIIGAAGGAVTVPASVGSIILLDATNGARLLSLF